MPVQFLVITINYSPEPTGFAPHATAICEYLASRGHEVAVLTGFPFAPKWKRWDEYRGSFTQTKIVNGVKLARLTHFIPRQASSLAQRVLMEGTFCLTALWYVVFSAPIFTTKKRAILYVGAQPALALLARGLSRIFRAPYFVNINDLAAAAAQDVGIVKNRWVHRLLNRFERTAYNKAAGATVLCARFGDWLTAGGFDRDAIRIIRSPIDTELIKPELPDGSFRQQLSIPATAFVVVCAGSMGLKQGLENVVNAAAAARDITWVLVGDGEETERLRRLAESRGLAETVRIVPFQPPELVSKMFADADVLLLNQLSQVKDTVVPSKLLTYMAAGRPVIAAVNADSEGAHILTEAGGGLVVGPGDPGQLTKGIHQLKEQSPEQLAELGRRNRRYAEAHFDSRQVLASHEQFMLSLIGP